MKERCVRVAYEKEQLNTVTGSVRCTEVLVQLSSRLNSAPVGPRGEVS